MFCKRDYVDDGVLVDHECINRDPLAFYLAFVDLGVLLVKESHKLGTIVSTIALRGEDESTRK